MKTQAIQAMTPGALPRRDKDKESTDRSWRKPNQQHLLKHKNSTLRCKQKQLYHVSLYVLKSSSRVWKISVWIAVPKHKNKNIHVLAMWLANTGDEEGGGKPRKSSHSIISLRQSVLYHGKGRPAAAGDNQALTASAQASLRSWSLKWCLMTMRRPSGGPALERHSLGENHGNTFAACMQILTDTHLPW